jgi:hypothetical protein
MTDPATSSSQSDDQVAIALQIVLKAQHAAVFAYSVVGVHLSAQEQIETAHRLQATHRIRRDQLMTALAARNVGPVATDPLYSSSVPVTGTRPAQRWALQLEQDSAAAYRALLANATGGSEPTAPLRQLAMEGLTAAARAATYWRSLLTPARPTVPFPGV